MSLRLLCVSQLINSEIYPFVHDKTKSQVFKLMSLVKEELSKEKLSKEDKVKFTREIHKINNEIIKIKQQAIKNILEKLELLPTDEKSLRQQEDEIDLKKQLYIHLSSNFETHALRLALSEKTPLVYELLIRHKLFYHEKSDLHFLVEEGNIEKIHEFFKSLPNDSSLLLALLKIQDKDGRTVLHYGAEERNIEKINKLFFLLLPNDSSSLFELLKIQDNFGHTVLHYETIFSNKDLFLPILDKISEDQLFELLKIQSNQEFIKGFTILHLYSFGCDNNDIILALMNKISKEKLSELSKIEDAYGNTFLHYFKDDEDIFSFIHDKIGEDS